jgi:hypothetical protein
MLDALKPLLDSGVLNEETRSAINEAWATKLTEAREQIRSEIREEFAGRYEHDKSVMVEAIDRMVTEALQAEIAEFQADKQAIAEHRVRIVSEMKTKSARFDSAGIASRCRKPFPSWKTLYSVHWLKKSLSLLRTNVLWWKPRFV